MKTIYLDNAATTSMDKQVLKEMKPFFSEKFGNASSQHTLGLEAKREMENARDIIAKSINAKSDEIIFTSGGTEANNLTIKGIMFANPDKNHIITTKIEHDCILNSCKWLETQGKKITYLNVDKEGFINIEELKTAITPTTALVSIIHGNNEIGTIQDLEEIGEICKQHNVYFHTDACQSYTKVPIDVKKMNLDLLTLNAHKIHGPKGIGTLYIKQGTKITPLTHGGGHEKGLRNGTENLPGIIGFAKSVQLAKKSHIKHMTKLRDYLIEKLLEIPNTNLNGAKENRLCNNINLRFNNIEGEAVGEYLDIEGICSSTGSACSSKNIKSSHVLKAIGLSNLEANSSIRLSISKFTTKQEINYIIIKIIKIIKKLRRISPFKSQ